MIRIAAVCDEERGCPLYKQGARIEFTPPSVGGVTGASVCMVAVEALRKPVTKVAGGKAPDAFARTSCGKCAAGEAWWDLEPLQQEEESADVSVILGNLTRSRIFSGLAPDKLNRITKLVKERRFRNQETALLRGQPGEAFHIVIEGEFEVIQTDENQVESTITSLPVGECFGEMSLISGEPVSATVRARGDSATLAVSQDDFHRMLAISPEIAITLSRVLAGRLARTSRWVIDELKKGMLGRLEAIPPAELVQAMNVNNQTGMLIVQDGEKTLSIYMHDGRVRQVEIGDKKGEEAFFEFLTWARGNFRFEPVRHDDTPAQVKMDTVGLLLEGMRRVDEARSGDTRVRPA